MSAPRRAVIGSGVAGLTAAHVLGTHGPVTLYEADPRLGGHADTHEVEVDGRIVGVDTGFIVHNDRTYPTLLRLFAELGVATQDSDMSMSVRDDESRLEYAGAKKAKGLFPRASNLTNPAYLRMLTEVKKFHREARDVLSREASDAGRDETLGAFAARCGFSPYFSRHFLEPVVAAVWSCDPAVSLQYPARYLFEFLDHHGMLTVFGSPTWRTVTGGSTRYVEAVAAGLDEIRLATPVTSVVETADGVVVVDARGGSETFDSVVIAAHPHQALAMLAEPTDRPDATSSARFTTPATSPSCTPTSRCCRTARVPAPRGTTGVAAQGDGGTGVLVTYDLTRLQRLDVPGTRFLVTLNGVDCVDQGEVIETMHLRAPALHPRIRCGTTPAARDQHVAHRLRRRLPRLGFPRGRCPVRCPRPLSAGCRLGPVGQRTAPDRASELPSDEGVTRDAHLRDLCASRAHRTPSLPHRFRTRSHSWLVDLDDLPRLGRLRRLAALRGARPPR